MNYFIGWNQADLEAELRVAQEDLAAGKNTSAAGAGDAHVESRIEKAAETRIKLLCQALNRLDPRKYPLDQVTPIERTRVVFGKRFPENLFDPL